MSVLADQIDQVVGTISGPLSEEEVTAHFQGLHGLLRLTDGMSQAEQLLVREAQFLAINTLMIGRNGVTSAQSVDFSEQLTATAAKLRALEGGG